MDYTKSQDYATHAATGQRMHEDNQATPTVVSDDDLNALAWELLALIKGAGLTPAQFNRDLPSTYQQVLAAVRSIAWGAGNTSAPWAFANHAHPTDTTRVAKSGDVMTGKLTFRGGTLESGGGFNSSADNDSGMDFPVDGNVRLRSNGRVAVEMFPDGSVKTYFAGNSFAHQINGDTVIYDATNAAKHILRADGSYTATGNIESQASVTGRDLVVKQTAVICNRASDGQKFYVYYDGVELKVQSSVTSKLALVVNDQGQIYSDNYGWLHNKFAARDGSTAMTAPLYVQGGAGGGIVSDIDRDTAIRFPSDGVRQDYVNGKLRAEYNSNTNVTRLLNESGHQIALQSDGNLVLRDAANNLVWDAFGGSQRYVSPDLTMSNGGQIVVNHGLGVEPTHISLYLKCAVAEFGYAVGDVIRIAGESDPNGVNESLGVLVNNTQIIVRVGDNGPQLITNKANGTGAAATTACWRLIIKASK